MNSLDRFNFRLYTAAERMSKVVNQNKISILKN